MIEVIPTHNGLTRLKTYTLDEIFNVIKKDPKKNYWQDGEYKIKITTKK